MIDIEISIHPQPYSGLSRKLGGLKEGDSIRDDKAIAKALRKIATELDGVDAHVAGMSEAAAIVDDLHISAGANTWMNVGITKSYEAIMTAANTERGRE